MLHQELCVLLHSGESGEPRSSFQIASVENLVIFIRLQLQQLYMYMYMPSIQEVSAKDYFGCQKMLSNPMLPRPAGYFHCFAFNLLLSSEQWT
jgi:hypothetical protein